MFMGNVSQLVYSSTMPSRNQLECNIHRSSSKYHTVDRNDMMKTCVLYFDELLSKYHIQANLEPRNFKLF